jgi:hypothetical protein
MMLHKDVTEFVSISIRFLLTEIGGQPVNFWVGIKGARLAG